MNAAARVVSDTCKYDRRLKTILHDEFLGMNVHERIQYKLGVMVYGLHDRTPRYLADHLIPAWQPLMLLLAVFVYDPLT